MNITHPGQCVVTKDGRPFFEWVIPRMYSTVFVPKETQEYSIFAQVQFLMKRLNGENYASIMSMESSLRERLFGIEKAAYDKEQENANK